MNPFSIVKFLFITSATGARQLVVHEAVEMILSSLFMTFSFTPKTIVLSESQVKYAFLLTLSGLPEDIDPIQTSKWDEDGIVTKEIKEEVFIFDNDVITKGTLIIQIQNVE